MFAINHNGQTFTEEETKADLVYSYYNALLGSPYTMMHRIDLTQLSLLTLDLSDQALPFSVEEVARAVRETSVDRAPRPDGFGTVFYRATWDIIGSDVVRVFQSL